jgi:hypothetical protein
MTDRYGRYFLRMDPTLRWLLCNRDQAGNLQIHFFGAGLFRRKDMMIGVSETCALGTDQDTNDRECMIECD